MCLKGRHPLGGAWRPEAAPYHTVGTNVPLLKHYNIVSIILYDKNTIIEINYYCMTKTLSYSINNSV